jgi:cytochrome b6-f complex iron-sulfur subunit
VSTHPDRAEFLRTAGSAALLAALGISLPGCAGGDPTNPSGGTPPVTPPPTDNTGATPGLSVSGNSLTVDLSVAAYSGLLALGGWSLIVRTVSGRSLSVLLVNVGDNRIRAFSSVCPHQGCNNSWQYSGSRFRCTCHDSVFENSGQRVSGPAPRDLTEYAASRNGNSLVITLT